MNDDSTPPDGAVTPALRRGVVDWLRFDVAPARAVLLLAALQVLLWGVLSARFDPAPPTDSLEQVLFSQDLRVFYVKHPALPTWILYGVDRLVGLSVASTFVLGSLCAALTLLLHYAWARGQMGAPRAAIATFLASTIVFFNAGAIQYNNNTVQLPLALLSIVVFHGAVTRGGRFAWALVGAAAGLMALAKLSAVVLFASFALYLLWSGRLRERATWHGLIVAALVFTALVAPPLIAASSMDPEADQYMRQMLFPPEVTRVRRLLSVWDFSMAQLAAVAPVLLLFAALRRSAPAAAPVDRGAAPLAPFLTIVGFGPLVTTLVMATLTGARLLSGWGTTFHVLLPLWLVAAQPFSLDPTRSTVKRTIVACIGVQALLWTILIANGGAMPNLYSKKHRHGPLAPPALAEAIKHAWAERTTQPLRYVVADIRTGAPMAVIFGGEPFVIDGNRPDFAKTFPHEAQSACGFVVVTTRPARDRLAANYDPLDDVLNQVVVQPVPLVHSNGLVGTYFIGVRPPANGERCVDPHPGAGSRTAGLHD